MPIYKVPTGGYRVQIAVYENGKKLKEYVRQNKETATKAGAIRVESELIRKFKTKPEDLDFESRMKLEQEKLLNLTLNDVINDYKVAKQNALRSSTKRGFDQSVRLFIQKPLGNLTLKSFLYNIQPLQLWKNRIDGMDYKLNYKNTIYKSLHSVFAYAKKIYGMPTNPLDRIGPFSDSIQSFDDKHVKYWTLEQFKVFDAALRTECEADDTQDSIRHWSYYVFYNLLFFCGLRKGEAYPLHWSDIKQKGNYWVLSIKKSMSQKVHGQDGDYEITPPKNRSSVREIPLCNRLIDVLKEHYKRCETVFGFDPKSEDFYICGIVAPVIDTNVENIKNRLAKQLKLPSIRIHDFRHSFVSLLINQDINIKTISKLVGHSTVDQTWNTYGHLYPEKANDAIECINRLI